MKKKWLIHAKKADFYGLAKQLQVDPVLVRLIRNRDIDPEDMDTYLHATLADLHDPHLLGAEQAADVIHKKITEKASIRIIGDYDIDGVNSTYILYQGLKKLGADVDYSIPDRIQDGYGLNRNLIDLALKDERQVILTCDNGIAAYDEISYAKDCGLTVVVTDHHNIPYEMEGEKKKEIIPPADAVVDPKFSSCKYPYEEICGAVVAMKFLQVLYEKFGRSAEEPLEFIEFAAFATVGDVMPLRDENRIIVKYGMDRMSHTDNIGLSALLKVNKIEKVKAYHLGFVLGPCINATGRLDSAMQAVSLLNETEPEKALLLAEELKNLNEERKRLTESGLEQAIDQIENAEWKKEAVYLVYLPETHESIAGIIAGRIRERYYRPAFVVTGKEEIVKGSARSIEAYSMYDEMTKCKELFTKFGGHPLAAGFSMKREDIPKLREALNKNANLTEEDLVEKNYIDVAMPLSYINEKLINQLDLMEPFGKDNAKPIFAAKNLTFISAVRIGKNKNMVRFTILTEESKRMTGIYFQDADTFFELIRQEYGIEAEEKLLKGRGNLQLSFAYYPSVNNYKGSSSLQVVISEFIL
jgi:single-stranded-DNA-specific exonuclease